MKRVLILASLLSLVSTPAQAQFFRRNRAQFVQTVQCAPTYQQQYYQPVYQPTQVVAAIPLATIPLATDLQAYQYSAIAGYFSNIRDYANLKLQSQGQEVSAQATTAQSNQVGEVADTDGIQVLVKNCRNCHQEGNKPKSDFAIFDKSGNIYSSINWNDVLGRVSAKEPSQRMPPGKHLSADEVMAIVRFSASVAVPQEAPRMADSRKLPLSPFD